jgi:ABC-2 type transport system permease protein
MTPTSLDLLVPVALSTRNRIRRRERGDSVRAAVFGGVAVTVSVSVFAIVFWLTWQLLQYEELGQYMLRLGLSWMFLTFLSFLAFSSLVVSLSTFFISEDLWLLLAVPVGVRPLFYSRFARVLVQAGWMVAAFVVPVLAGVGVARCAGPLYYLAIPLSVLPFIVIPVAVGSAVTLVIVNTFPARRARDILVLAGLFFAASLVALVRFLKPERLMSVDALPDVTAFFSTLDTPITSFLPSFWAGETLFAAANGHWDFLHLGALWTTALAATVLLRLAFERHYLSGWSKAQEGRKARFTRLRLAERLAERLPIGLLGRQLLLKDVKLFLRDATQWSQLLLLLALAFVYLYSFRVLDPNRIPYMGEMVRTAYAFLNLAMAGFILSAIAVRFVFPSVSAEGPAFWIVRTAPVSMSSFLWSKFWSGLVPILVLVETLTLVSNHFLRADPFLKILAAVAVVCMTFALVGLAAGMGAMFPRFRAENVAQVAGSYGGVAFMIVAVLFILVELVLLAWPASIYLWHQFRGLSMAPSRQLAMSLAFGLAFGLCVAVFWWPMRRGVRALEALEE